jgi:hypothetical protein
MAIPHPEVLLSFDRRQRSEANELAAALRSRGLAVWSEFDVVAGDDWEASWRAAFGRIPTYVVLLSHTYPQSPELQIELGAALAMVWQRKHRIIPVFLRGEVPERLPREILRLQGIEWHPGGTDEVADAITRATQRSEAA